jgi:hypothetical protein
VLRRPIEEAGDDLVTHELCHVWQMQHHPLAMPLSYLYRGYRDNPNEVEARLAATTTRRSTVELNENPGEVPPSRT